MNLPSSTVILSTSQDPRRLQIVLERLACQTQPPSQLVVAEDGEHAETQQLLQTWTARLPFRLDHVRQLHFGFRKSKILNQAILRATGDIVILLDGDCAPHPRFVADHLALAQPNYFVQGRRSFIEEKGIDAFARGTPLWKLWFSGYLKRPFKALRLPVPRLRHDTKIDGALGCNLAIWKADLEAVNGFDESYEGWGREDGDLVARLLHLGRKRIVVWGQALVFHLNHPTQPRTGLASNDQRLAAVLAARSIRAERGLDAHRPAASRSAHA